MSAPKFRFDGRLAEAGWAIKAAADELAFEMGWRGNPAERGEAARAVTGYVPAESPA